MDPNTQNVPVDRALLDEVRAISEKTGIRIKALVEQGIRMRLDALAKEKK
jgi:hypothetical protein